MILIVDDKQENLFSLKTLLEINKFSVDTASSGEEALKKVLKKSYALIILDVQMPDIDGFEVAEAISSYNKTKDVPIIFLSAVNTDKRFITKGYSAGGIDYVTKPFDPDILLLKVKTFYRLYEQNLELTNIQHALKAEIEFRKQAENELQNTVTELRSILESLPQIAFTINQKGEVIYANRHWYDYAENKNSFPATTDKSKTIRESVDIALQERAQSFTEVTLLNKKTGYHRHHLLGMTPMKRGEVIFEWLGILTDIHVQKEQSELLEQKVAERTEELTKTNLQLKEANDELSQFAWIASHDLQEPLRKIQLFSHILKDKYLEKGGEAAAYLQRIIHSSSRMNNLIRDVLSYTRLSFNETTLNELDLNIVVAEVLNDYDLLVKEKQALVQVNELPKIYMAHVHAVQIFNNLIGNALKYSKENTPPCIKISAELVKGKSFKAKAMPGGDYCRISVEDNGIGFNEEYTDKIFTIFKRLHSLQEFSGNGIGLAIVKKIVDKYHGIITASSQLNKGAVFTIVLPAHFAENN